MNPAWADQPRDDLGRWAVRVAPAVRRSLLRVVRQALGFRR